MTDSNISPAPSVSPVSGNPDNLTTLDQDGLIYTRKFYTVSSELPVGDVGFDGDLWFVVDA